MAEQEQVPQAAVEAAAEAFENVPDNAQFRERLKVLPEYDGCVVVPPADLAAQMLSAAYPAIKAAVREEVLEEVRGALLAVGVEAAAKRRWEMSQSTGPFAALGPSWEGLKRDVHLRERADLKPQYEKALVAARREIETAVDAALATLTDQPSTEEGKTDG